MKTELIGHAVTPTSADIRAQLHRIVNDPIFRGSPQLASFLTFVVEAVLAGERESLKGYTIAVGALGRGESFDPQSDPIVRVEAGRLRRALERYYAETGSQDPIRIELPRGSYVPIFEIVGHPTFAMATMVPAADPNIHETSARPTPWYRQPASVALVIAMAVMASAGFNLLDNLVFGRQASSERPDAVAAAAAAARSRILIDPVMLVEPVEVVGVAPDRTLTPSALYGRLSDAIARSDSVTLVTEPRDAQGAQYARQPDYRLSSALIYNADETLDLTFRLIDAADSTVLWTRKFESIKFDNANRSAPFDIVREIATKLTEPYGVLFADRRARLRPDQDSRARCYFESFDYLRDRKIARHVAVRDCLERAVAAEPGYAIGYSLLALVYLSEHLFNVPRRPGDSKPLDRALETAIEALRIKPASAFAQAALVDIYANRGELDDALAAGHRAMELNPYDATVNYVYGSQLIFRGNIAQGRALLKDYLRLTPVAPPRANYAMFIAAYLDGDIAEAARYANRITDPDFAFGHLARALIAIKRDDIPRARESLTRFYALQPAWKADPHAELRKHHASQPIFDRLSQELDEANRRTVM